MSKRVLIVDDEPYLSEIFRGAVGTTNIDFLSVSDGVEAVRYLSDERFDVVLLGLRMPSMDGIDLTRQIRGSVNNRTTPVIVVSDDQQLSAVSLAFEAGASFFLYKPVDQGQLLRLIRAAQHSVEHERRHLRRVTCRMKVHLKSESGELQGETVDMSLDGILVRVTTTIPALSDVRVALYLLPDSKPVVGMGFVARVIGAHQMGIHLDRVSEIESAKLQDFLLPLMTEGPADE
jgi:DNA-binding response OmpR family regulator